MQLRTSACTTTAPPQATMLQALLRLRIVAEFDSDVDIFDRTRGGPISKRGSKVLEPLLRAREQGTHTSEAAWELHHIGVTTTYVGDRPGPPTSSAQSIWDWCISVGNQTRDLLHCRRTLYAKSHSNGVINCYSEPQLVLLQLPFFVQVVNTILLNRTK